MSLEQRINELEQRLVIPDLTGMRVEELSDWQLATIICPDDPQAVLDLPDEDLARIANGEPITNILEVLG